VSVKQSFLDKFDRQYLLNCDNKQMSKEKRGLSSDNPFKGKPFDNFKPEQILSKPGELNLKDVPFDPKPEAGKLTAVGKLVKEGQISHKKVS
jgi:hypothetical protein